MIPWELLEQISLLTVEQSRFLFRSRFKCHLLTPLLNKRSSTLWCVPIASREKQCLDEGAMRSCAQTSDWLLISEDGPCCCCNTVTMIFSKMMRALEVRRGARLYIYLQFRFCFYVSICKLAQLLSHLIYIHEASWIAIEFKVVLG